MTKHKIVVGLGFGDEGKGTVVDAMCAKDDYGFVVRFSGGPQAAHNVVLDDGTHHTFSQFGSGTFSGTRTILSRFMLINPFNMVVEADALQKKIGYDPMELLYISENSLVITEVHVRANRRREKRRGNSRHGSCGQGVGEAQKMALEAPHLALYAKDLINMSEFDLSKRLRDIHNHYVHDREVGNLWDNSIVIWEHMAKPYKNLINDRPFNVVSDDFISKLIGNSPCVFEGSQGVLLDEWNGFHPYTTWSTTTPENACTLLQEAGVKDSDIEIIGVTRTYQTRHGAGPFPTEHVGTFSARYLASRDVHNTWGEFQGGWRVGNLDFVLLEYSKKVVGRIDSIALTHMDQEAVWVNPVVAYGYSDPVDLSSEYKAEHDLGHQEHLTATLESLDPEKFWYSGSGGSDQIKFSIEMILGAPVLIESYGPERGKKEFYYLDGPTKRRYNKDHVGINQ